MKARSELCESPAEEFANAVSHGLGALFSAIGLVVMICMAASASVWHVVSVSVFGVSLVLLYLASTVYHSVTSPRHKSFFQILDHCLIFVLIAGSYTPWLLVNLRGAWGWSLFGTVWGLALAGMIMKAILLPRFEKTGTALYVVMGWLICVAFKPLLASVGTTALIWLVLGGLAYTVGVVFYLMRNVKFSHCYWHLFVLLGSMCHVIAVMVGVIPHR